MNIRPAPPMAAGTLVYLGNRIPPKFCNIFCVNHLMDGVKEPVLIG